MREPGVTCERDEYPGARLWNSRDDNVWIRFLPRAQNGGAGAMWRGICPEEVVTSLRGVAGNPSTQIVPNACRNIVWVTQSYLVVNTVFSMRFANMPAYADDGLTENPCYPSVLANDPGFALRGDDSWYSKATNANRRPWVQSYKVDPDNAILGLAALQGWPKAGYTKRDATGEFDPEDIVIDEGNSTRKPTEEELLKDFGFLKCKDGCKDEMKQMGFASLPYAQGLSTSPCSIDATATSFGDLPTTLSKVWMTVSKIMEEAPSMITPPPKNLHTQ